MNRMNCLIRLKLLLNKVKSPKEAGMDCVLDEETIDKDPKLNRSAGCFIC